MVGVANTQRADEDPLAPACAAPRTTCVVASPVPWIRCHGRGGVVRRRRDPRLDELPLRGDLTRGRVDEEEPPSAAEDTRARADARVARARSRCSTPTCAAAAPPRSTRRAYGDRRRPVRALGERRTGSSRPTSTPRDAAPLRRRRCRRSATAPSTVARKLASLRALFRDAARARRASAQNPADLLAGAEARRATLPRVLKRRRGRRAARPHPRRRRRSSCATARCSSSPTPAGCAPRSSSTSTSARSTSTPRRCASRARAARRASCPVGEPALRAVARYLERGRPALHDGRRRAGAVPLEVRAGGCRPPTCAAACASGRGTPRCRAASRRTRCATRSRRTCSTAAPTCARSRSCSATRASPRRRSTLG